MLFVECTQEEVQQRDQVSHPYKRRNHNAGVLTETEKQLYRNLFGAPRLLMTPKVSNTAATNSSCDGTDGDSNCFVPFFDAVEGVSYSSEGCVQVECSGSIRTCIDDGGGHSDGHSDMYALDDYLCLTPPRTNSSGHYKVGNNTNTTDINNEVSNVYATDSIPMETY